MAFVGRTSTLALQDPVQSLTRQIRRSRERLPGGWFISAYYWDIESGGTDLDQRSHHGEFSKFLDAGIPRDGGMADLRAAAASPSPGFSAVICEDIERSGRDTFDALRLEKELRAHGMLVFAADEPIDVEAAGASIILVRRMKQGVAEYFRYQLKEKCWQGLKQHAIAGWNNGPTPYGFIAERITHDNPMKAAQGRTRTRLAIDPEAGPWVTQMFEWRVYQKLSREAIAGRLDAAGVPSRDGNPWSPATVGHILANPKYTGYMVYGRTRNVGTGQRKGERKIRRVPPDKWTWSPEPAHPALVTRELWEAAQDIGAQRGNVRDTETPTTRTGTRYPLRSRMRCNQCQHRMNGSIRTGRSPDQTYTYYLCPLNYRNPRQAAAHPDHIRAAIREEIITAALAGFLDDHVLGHDRAAMLDTTLPATAAEEAARRQDQAGALRRKLAQYEASEKGLMTEVEQLGTDTSPAANAYRARIRERFTEIYDHRAATQAELDALTGTPASAEDPTLLDELPYAPGILQDAPDTLREALYAALDIQCLYRADKQQVTIWATITDTTPGIITALLNDPRTDTDTGPATPAPAPLGDSATAAIAHRNVKRSWV